MTKPSLLAQGAAAASVCVAWLAATSALPGLHGQEPPPDSVVVDSLATDTLQAADSVAPPIPRFLPPIVTGPGTQSWEWDRPALLSMRGYTLLDLLAEIPGTVPVRSGDYGLPRTVAAFGGGPVRVLRDGIEISSLQGGVVDLSLVPLVGIDRVRVTRTLAGLRVELFSLEPSEPAPYTLLQAATGDLQTNVLRGVLLHPRALGGSVEFGFDRLDTRGAGGDEEASTTGLFLRYTRHWGEEASLSVEFRRQGADRDTLVAPAEITRTGLTLDGRYRVAPGMLLQGTVARESLDGDQAGIGLAPVEPIVFPDRSRLHLQGRVSVDRGPWWTEGVLRRPGGDGLADLAAETAAGWSVEAVGGVEGRFVWERWEGEGIWNARLAARTRTIFGLSLFGEIDHGEYGIPYVGPFEVRNAPMEGEEDEMTGGAGLAAQEGEEDPPPLFRSTEREGIRAGVQIEVGGALFSGAALRVEADTLHPLGLPFESSDESGALSLAGGTRSGWEAYASIPTFLLDGLRVVGEAQVWESRPEWRYLPSTIYRGRLDFHDVFLETGNFELWVQVGAEGREGMRTPAPDQTGDPQSALLGTPVGTSLSWFAKLEMRIVSVHIFASWENFTFREFEDLPGRTLPTARAMYGLRWPFSN